MNELIYLDNNGTTQMDPDVIDKVAETMKNLWANPSSTHKLGLVAKEAIENARRQTAAAIGISHHYIT